MGHKSVDSDSPFTNDSSHGISRDAIVYRLGKIEDRMDNSDKKLESILIALAKIPPSCPKAEQCGGMWNEIETLKLDKAKQEGAVAGGKVVLASISSLIGAAFALITFWFTYKKP